jgi:hypothetical protein
MSVAAASLSYGLMELAAAHLTCKMLGKLYVYKLRHKVIGGIITRLT